ncbi:MAG: hypothetical protein GYA46_04525 [candidate division Zixibacteria bacterium]|nr:hypothetical protein [candidate division Zixibacteria bacterium]
MDKLFAPLRPPADIAKIRVRFGFVCGRLPGRSAGDPKGAVSWPANDGKEWIPDRAEVFYLPDNGNGRNRVYINMKNTTDSQTRAGRPKRFWESKLVLLGLAIVVFGSGPLIGTMLAAELGLTEDPNPNPVVFGIMAMLTFWPGIALILVGLSRIRSHNSKFRWIKDQTPGSHD